MAKTAVLCSICGKIATNTCTLCGRKVCERHFDSKLGLCDICKSGRSMK